MIFKPRKNRPPIFCIVLSILVHLLAVNCLGWFGRFDLSLAKVQPPFEMIDVTLSSPPVPPTQSSGAVQNGKGLQQGAASASSAATEEICSNSTKDGNHQVTDRLTNRSLKEPLPNPEVVDILSGLYFLRNRTLQVGTVETLHIYDSDTYAAVPVDVIRRETVRLPAFREVEALLVQPRLKTGGIFKRTCDVQIWLSDDRYKVPVKIVTSIALCQVTVELMSAESEHPDRP